MAGLLASSALSTHTTTITVSNVQEQRKHRVRGGGGAARTFRPDTMRAFSSTSTSSPPAPLNRTGTFMLMSFALLSASDVLVSFNRPSGEPTGSAPAPAGPPALVPAVAVAAVRPDMAGLAEPTGAAPATTMRHARSRVATPALAGSETEALPRRMPGQTHPLNPTLVARS